MGPQECGGVGFMSNSGVINEDEHDQSEPTVTEDIVASATVTEDNSDELIEISEIVMRSSWAEEIEQLSELVWEQQNRWGVPDADHSHSGGARGFRKSIHM